MLRVAYALLVLLLAAGAWAAVARAWVQLALILANVIALVATIVNLRGPEARAEERRLRDRRGLH